jgi:uncharacterized protein (DUF362 family)
MDRRCFLARMASGAVATGLGLFTTCGKTSVGRASASANAAAGGTSSPSLIARARGADYPAITRAAVEALGGISKHVPHGASVVIKPNVGWDRPVHVCANTNTEVLRAVIEMVLEAGARDVRIVDHPVDSQNPVRAFEHSGMNALAKETGIEAYPVQQREGYVRVEIPHGVTLKSAEVIREVLDADVLINVPVAKSHACTKFTGALKNWMGIVYDRRFFHHNFMTNYRTSPEHWNHIAQCIADIQLRIRPALTVMDATTIMTTNGPGGPGRLEQKNEVLAAEDPVALDTYAVGLFENIALHEVWSIDRAAKLGLGQMDLSKVEIRDVA